MLQRPSTSSERTPLVAPAYVFESSMTRRYHQRLRNCQCVICVLLLSVLGVALLVTVSYNLSQDLRDVPNITDTPTVEEPLPSPRPNLTITSPDLQPLLQLSWPLKGPPRASWVGDGPTTETLDAAVEYGKSALNERRKVESGRKPLAVDSPAGRAQRAAATAGDVKPISDAAYAAEYATRALVNGTDSSQRGGDVGLGPLTAGSFPEPPYCTPNAPACAQSKYRTQDGTCNNFKNSLRWGVANTPFRRVLPPDYADGVSAPRIGKNGSLLPSARDVSVTVHRPSYSRESTFTVMLAVWGQFVDHDITATALSKGENSSSLSCCDPSLPAHPECFPVPLDIEDPFYRTYNLTCMEFVRSAAAPTCHFGPREQLNQATVFIDGSVVYGHSQEKALRLRTGSQGLLRMLQVGGRELLPPSSDPNDGCNNLEMNAKGRYCFESGDDRANENLHLTTMHLLWARQHNRLATMLRKLNTHWDDETLYQEARKIVGAQMQHSTYTEFLPPILGSDVMSSLNLTVRSSGFSDAYDPDVDPTIANHFAASAFRFAHTLLPGLIHNVNQADGSVEYVHLHEVLFNPYALYGEGGPTRAIRSAMDTPVHGSDPHVTDELSNHLFERPVSANSSVLTPKLSPCGLDLVSLNIQRGRDHGLPSYPAWRELCGFPRPKTFQDLEGVFDDSSLNRISLIYKHVEDIDMYTGSLSEDPRGRLLGPTLTCLLTDQFLRIKVGDRFWYETSDRTVGFSIEQLTEIRKTTLAGVICANEGQLDRTHARAMEAVSPRNPLVDCRELPQPDFTPWRHKTR